MKWLPVLLGLVFNVFSLKLQVILNTKHPLWPLVNFQILARSDNIPSTSKPNWEPKAEEFVALASSKPSYSSVSLAATAQSDPSHSPPSDQNSIHHLLRLWANRRKQRLFLAFIVSRLTAVLWLVIAPKRLRWKSQLPIMSQGDLSVFIRQVTTAVMIGGRKGRWKKKKYIKMIPLGQLWASKKAFYTLATVKVINFLFLCAVGDAVSKFICWWVMELCCL